MAGFSLRNSPHSNEWASSILHFRVLLFRKSYYYCYCSIVIYNLESLILAKSEERESKWKRFRAKIWECGKQLQVHGRRRRSFLCVWSFEVYMRESVSFWLWCWRFVRYRKRGRQWERVVMELIFQHNNGKWHCI